MEYPERQDLKLILQYVEDWNKKDENMEVSTAAAELQEWLDNLEAEITKNL